MNADEKWTLELEPHRSAPAAARQAVTRHLPFLNDGIVVDVQLLVSELVTNALVHADLEPDDRIRVVLAHADGEVRVEVCDPGQAGGEPAPRENPGLGGGYGLLMVEQLSTRWGVRRNERRCVWFVMDAGSAN